MSDLIEQLWPAFQAEGSEQLEALELALVNNAGAGDIDLNAVFRYFHTIKGGCAMMGFASMESIAHACEDLLDPVRKGSQALTDSLVDALLAAIDCLKLQMATAERTRQDPESQPELLARLRALLAPAASAPATTAAVAEKTPDHAALASAGRDVLPLVAEETLRAKPWRKTMREQLLHLAREALVVAPAIMRLCDRLATAAPGAARLAVLADLLDRMAWVERSAGLAAGTEAAARVLRQAGEDGFRAAVKLAGSHIEAAFDPGSGAPLPAQLPAALDSLDALLLQARLLRLVHSTRLLRLALQLLRDVHRELLPPNPSLARLLQLAIGLPAEILEGLDEDEPYAAMCAQLDEKLQQLTVGQVRGADLSRRCNELQRALEMSPGTLALLHPEGLDRLESAVARYETIVELSTDPETASDAGSQFFEWLSASGILLGSYTLAAGNGLCFVMASPLSPEELQRGLSQLEPRPAPLVARHCRYRDDTAAAVSPVPVAGVLNVAAEAEPGRAGANGAGTAGTLRVDSSTVDIFVNRIGEMVMLRNMMAHALQSEDMVLRHSRVSNLVRDCGTERTFTLAELQEFRSLLGEIEAQREELVQADARLQGSLARLQEDVLALRVVPIALVFNRLPRLVRDLAHGLDRQVHLEISGEEVRIDKGMVDVLSEPMMHLVRNALDHGIESPTDRVAAGKPAQARLCVAARQQGNTLLVEVSDDGRGLDHDRIRARAISNGLLTAEAAATLAPRELHNLIFLPGFSTATQVTEVSGRGVGMDAVKTRVLKLGGQVEVSTEAGKGTTFTLRLPLSAAIQNVILVDAGGRQLAIPERNVTEILSLPASALQSVQGQACCLLRGVTLPLYHLARLLGQQESAAPASATLEVVVLTDGVYRIGLIVERVIGRPEVFIRDIHPDLVRLPGVGGASILGDGRVVIIVDCENLFELAVRQAQSLHSLLRAS